MNNYQNQRTNTYLRNAWLISFAFILHISFFVSCYRNVETLDSPTLLEDESSEDIEIPNYALSKLGQSEIQKLDLDFKNTLVAYEIELPQLDSATDGGLLVIVREFYNHPRSDNSLANLESTSSYPLRYNQTNNAYLVFYSDSENNIVSSELILDSERTKTSNDIEREIINHGTVFIQDSIDGVNFGQSISVVIATGKMNNNKDFEIRFAYCHGPSRQLRLTAQVVVILT
jgi:hypothetical protein